MENKQDSHDMSYKVGYAIGKILFTILFGWFKLVFKGFYYSEDKLIELIGYIIAIILSHIIHDASIYALIVVLNMYAIKGIYISIKDYKVSKKRKYFNSIFRQIKLHDKSEGVPYYLYEKDISDYAMSYAFNSLIPLSEWQSKRELLEVYLNEKIVDLKQDENDNRTTYIIIQHEALPNILNWDDRYLDIDNNVLLIGYSYLGFSGMDLEKYPHSFIAGETGSGKTNILKCMIHQALLKNYEVVLIDFKRGVSFTNFTNVTIYYEYDSAMEVLEKTVLETNRRLDLFRKFRVEHIKDYNKITSDLLPRKIIFIDELAELLKVRDKELSNSIYDSIETITRLSRAVGIHLIMGVQRPDSTIINGQIKNNVSFRVCGRFVDKEPSRIMLNSDIASKLINIKGRFVVRDNELYEIQSFYFLDSHNYQKDAIEEIPITNYKIENFQQEELSINQKDETKLSTDKLEFDFSDII